MEQFSATQEYQGIGSKPLDKGPPGYKLQPLGKARRLKLRATRVPRHVVPLMARARLRARARGRGTCTSWITTRLRVGEGARVKFGCFKTTLGCKVDKIFFSASFVPMERRVH